MFKITDVRVVLEQVKTSTCKAHVSIVLDDCLLISGLRLITSDKGLFLSMPDRAICFNCLRCKRKVQLRHRFCPHCGFHTPYEQRPKFYQDNGNPRYFMDNTYPLNQVTRNYIFECIHGEYLRVLNTAKEQQSTREESPTGDQTNVND